MDYIDTTNQVATFLWSLALGAVMCLLYDGVRVLHKFSIKGFFEVMISDIIFWLIAASVTFCFLVLRCQGEVRGYVLAGQAIGFTAARFTVSRFFVLGLSSLFKAISKLLGTFGKGFHFIAAVCEKNIKKILKYIKKVLQHKAKLLYNQLKMRSERKEKKTDKH